MGCDVCIGTTDIDSADVYDAVIVTARRQHVCCECRKPINRGDKYERVSMMSDGWSRYRTCMSCKEIRDVFVCGESWMFGSIWDEMREYAFPHLTTASECFRQLNTTAKERVLAEWRSWKGIEQEKR